MRIGLQRQLACPKTLRFLHNALQSFGQVNFPAALCIDCARQRPIRLRRNSNIAVKSLGDLSHEERSQHDLPKAEKLSKDALVRRQSVDFKPQAVRPLQKAFTGGKSWRKYLRTFAQIDEQADLSSQSLHLVKHVKFRTDFELWLELVRFRRRIYGVDGLRIIWKHIQEGDLRLPTYGYIAEELWQQFLDLGFEDDGVLKELFVYAMKLKADTGSSWHHLYAKTLAQSLQQNPSKAWVCHTQLKKYFPPTVQQFQHLIPVSLSNKMTRRVFLRIHKEFPNHCIYDTAIPELCRRKMYTTALKWHRILAEDRNDLPSSSKICEPLIRYLTLSGDTARTIEITQRLVAAGVPFSAPLNRSSKPNLAISGNFMSNQLAEVFGIKRIRFDDAFCARLFATKVFSIDTAINGLSILGVDNIGPISLREMASKEHEVPYSMNIRQRLKQLEERKISIGKSTFSLLVRRLANENQDLVLKDLVTCDLHPDTFDDKDLQENLLAFYQDKGDQVAFDRTLAVLTARTPSQLRDVKRSNLILRAHMARRDVPNIVLAVERMRELRLPIESLSCSYLRTTVMQRRKLGKRPLHTKDLHLVIRVWQYTLQSGGIIAPLAWREILRRLGKSHRLTEFETLALWLVDWYSSPKGAQRPIALRKEAETLLPRHDQRYSRRSLQLTSTAIAYADDHVDVDSSPPDRLHLSRTLFPSPIQQGIIAWGFQHSALRSRNRQPCWTWGLLLLRKLQARGILVNRAVVAKACRQRLQVLFGPARPTKRRFNERKRRHNRETVTEYVKEAESIWGKGLFRDRENLPRYLVRKEETEKVVDGRRSGLFSRTEGMS
ncbi:MAG: hypothetical protein LQ342_006791 [Letrouitia transgressa]|nr:MAG: hypothetical protein LQ342_006791 [Letrouitia transgressa]